ncbi:hypothetical protein EV702DRAFT_1046377 [Suillus placidus]|uniref:Uncharacterized protein n=1 Tax=Suillus placidus TaxID=48579 RepID=A0A9P6ZTH8_9AGAM|nr:hypothetical protein EV702DRAFT_1046377 [Suillus placidus]
MGLDSLLPPQLNGKRTVMKLNKETILWDHMGALKAWLYFYAQEGGLDSLVSRQPSSWRINQASHMTSIIAAEGLLIFRTFAFWHQSKTLLVWLIVFAANCIAGAVGVTKAVNILHPAPPTGSHTHTLSYRGST